mgnify:CR=1 FL=1
MQFLVLLALVFSLSSCLDPGAPVNLKSLRESGSEKKVKSEAKSLLNDDKVFEFLVVGNRDPFEPFVRRVSSKARKEFKRRLTPLQTFDLVKIAVVGIVSGIPNPKAMVETPDGKSYLVESGTPIGMGCRVKFIRKNEIILREDRRAEDQSGLCTKLVMHAVEQEKDGRSAE